MASKLLLDLLGLCILLGAIADVSAAQPSFYSDGGTISIGSTHRNDRGWNGYVKHVWTATSLPSKPLPPRLASDRSGKYRIICQEFLEEDPIEAELEVNEEGFVLSCSPPTHRCCQWIHSSVSTKILQVRRIRLRSVAPETRPANALTSLQTQQ